MLPPASFKGGSSHRLATPFHTNTSHHDAHHDTTSRRSRHGLCSSSRTHAGNDDVLHEHCHACVRLAEMTGMTATAVTDFDSVNGLREPRALRPIRTMTDQVVTIPPRSTKGSGSRSPAYALKDPIMAARLQGSCANRSRHTCNHHAALRAVPCLTPAAIPTTYDDADEDAGLKGERDDDDGYTTHHHGDRKMKDYYDTMQTTATNHEQITPICYKIGYARVKLRPLMFHVVPRACL
jgi:hypothetical protein